MAHFQVERLRRLPQHADEVWQGGLLRLPLWDEQVEGGPRRLWAAVWLNPTERTVHMSSPQPAEQTNFDMARDTLVELAVNPKLAGYRPGRLDVNDATLAAHLAEQLGEIGIAVRHEPQLEVLQKGLAETPELQPPVRIDGMLSVKGVTVERIRAFAEAALEFHRAEPWLRQNDGDLIQVNAPKVPKGLECAAVMGEAREVYGLALFASLKQYETMMRTGTDYFRSHGAWSMIFDPIVTLPIHDADLWEDQHLPMTGEHACPMAYYHGARGQTKRPTPAQLTYLEGLLRAIARTSEQEMDSGRWSKTVETFDGTVEYQLTMPRMLEPVLLPRTTHQLEVLDWPNGLEGVRELAEHIGRKNPSLSRQQVLQQALAESVKGWEPIDKEDVDRPLTSAEQADYLADLASEHPSHRMRVRLIRMALELDPDCIEAYLQMGLAAQDPEQRLEYYRQAVAAGQRCLTPEELHSPGKDWESARPESYLFAWKEMVSELAEMRRFEEAVEQGLELLRADRQDSPDVRYVLLLCLLILGRDEQAEQVWRQFASDDHPTWLYLRALLTFRREGSGQEASDRLLEALQTDESLAEQLTGQEPQEEEDEQEPEQGYSLTPEDMEDESALQAMQDELENLSRYAAEGMDDGFDPAGPGPHEEDLSEAEIALLEEAWTVTPEALQWLQQELTTYQQTQDEDDEE